MNIKNKTAHLGKGLVNIWLNNFSKKNILNLQRKWYSINKIELLKFIDSVNFSSKKSADDFRRVILWKDITTSTTLALHFWFPSSEDTNVVTAPHNHRMSVTSLIIKGAINQEIFSLQNDLQLIKSWLKSSQVSLKNSEILQYKAGDTYYLKSNQVHLVRNPLNAYSVTLFTTFPNEFGGNFFVSEDSEDVSLKVSAGDANFFLSLKKWYQAEIEEEKKEFISNMAFQALTELKKFNSKKSLLI